MPGSLYARLARRFAPEVRRFDRRQFLQLTLAAGAGALAGCSTLPAGSGRRVVVVGAGLAGLACASELRRCGCDVIVLEARQRVGGRVLTFKDFLPGKVIEGGAELIGSNHPAWVAYARQFGLSFLDVTENESLHDPTFLNKRLLDATQARRLFEEMQAVFARLTAAAATVSADQPWRSPQAAQLDRQSVADWLRPLEMSADCRAAVTAQFEGDNNQALARQSLLGLLAQIKGGGLEHYWTESEVYRCLGGNQQLAVKLAEQVGQDRLRLGTAVRRIELDKDRARVTATNDSVWEADDVVLAVPPPAWDRMVIEPPLPESLRPNMGLAIKWLSTVRERFWETSGLGPNALTDRMVSMTWDPSDGQSAAGGAGLTVFSGGPAAEQCRQSWREQGPASFRSELELLFPGYGVQAVDHRFMDWPSDEWTRCGYSAAEPGEITRLGPVWHEGVGRLHFAGEHTCCPFAGYMEGALQSGIRAARTLAKAAGRMDMSRHA